jgi:hypothetical protein
MQACVHRLQDGQLAISVHYNWDIIKRRGKDKKHHGLIAALREGPTQLGPTSLVCYHCGQTGTSTENAQKGGQPGRQPCPPPGLCLLCKGNH